MTANKPVEIGDFLKSNDAEYCYQVIRIEKRQDLNMVHLLAIRGNGPGAEFRTVLLDTDWDLTGVGWRHITEEEKAVIARLLL